MIFEQMPHRIERRPRPVVTSHDLHVCMESATLRADITLRADLLRGRNGIPWLHHSSLGVQDFDIIPCGLEIDRVPLFDHDTPKLRLDFLDPAVNGRPHAAVRLHPTATVHVKAHMRGRACAPVSTELTLRRSLITVIRRLNQVH
jgi:hypothetical protein